MSTKSKVVTGSERDEVCVADAYFLVMEGIGSLKRISIASVKVYRLRVAMVAIQLALSLELGIDGKSAFSHIFFLRIVEFDLRKRNLH